MAERGELAARDTLLRVIQRDKSDGKRRRAQALLESLDSTAN